MNIPKINATVSCPYCLARKGQPCKSATNARVSRPHSQRRRAAELTEDRKAKGAIR